MLQEIFKQNILVLLFVGHSVHEKCPRIEENRVNRVTNRWEYQYILLKYFLQHLHFTNSLIFL